VRRLALPLLAALVLASCGPAASRPAAARSGAASPAAAQPVAAVSPAARTPAHLRTRASYRRAASAAIAKASAWWDPQRHWYRQRFGNSSLATNWGIVHLFDATDALAIADPTPAGRAAVRAFARGAERYWNPDLRPVPGYGPSQGNRGAGHRSWYDDEGWWGVAFYDAFRATGDRRYLASADRSLAFLDSGWDPKSGGVYWDTRRTFKASESLAGGALLAAYLYRDTHAPKYLALVKRYVAWADRRLLGSDGLYSSRPRGVGVPMPYVEGPMALAFELICKSTGDQSWCKRAEDLAGRTAQRFPRLTMGPQYDSIYVRALLELYRLDGKRRWYDIAAAATNRAAASARASSGLYLLTWDGRPIQTIGADPGKLQTHAATASVLAWMAAARPPAGR
jgi:uncharacterized protein YyaL (SSP411 family)